jgi:SOS-response transcriptional repressor LexA
MSLGQIIRKKREQLNLTLDEVSSRVGFSKPYLSTIETGKVKNPPSDELLTRLEKTLEFESGQLLHIAHIEGLPSDIRQEYESAGAENEKFRQFVKNLVHKKNDIAGLDAVLSESKLDLDELSRVDIEQGGPVLSAGRLVPVINKVSAGYPSDFNDLDYPVGIADDYVRCPDLHDPNAFAVRVVGDSMEPKFREGDIVIFSPVAEVHNGDDCFVRFAMPHETAFKRVFFDPDNKVRLQPRNEKYSPTIIDGKRINGLYRAIVKYEKL